MERYFYRAQAGMVAYHGVINFEENGKDVFEWLLDEISRRSGYSKDQIDVTALNLI